MASKVKLTRKERYMNRMIDWMANNESLNDIYHSRQSELQKDYQVVNFLLASGRYHLEITRNEVCLAMMEAQSTKAKSGPGADKYAEEAEQYRSRGQLLNAYVQLSNAIIYQPQNTDADCKRLASLYLRRMKLLLESKPANPKAAAKDIEFALCAQREFTLSQLTSEEKQLHEQYHGQRDKQPMSLHGDTESECTFPAQVHSSVEVTKQSSYRQTRYVAVAKQRISPDTTVISEKAFVKIGSPLHICLHCDSIMPLYQSWSCEFCTEALYCSKQCYEQDFEFHKYECGIAGFAGHVPVLLLMLRFYVRANKTPLSPCPSQVDHVQLYLEAIKKGQSGTEHALNAFRQTMDNHPKRHAIFPDRRNYYAIMVLAMEFLYLYDAALYNGKCIGDRRAKKQAGWKETDSSMVTLPEMPPELGWAKDFSDKTEMVALVLRDLKRFIVCPSAKFESLPVSMEKYRQEQRRILLLNTVLFQSDSHTIHNLVPYYLRDSGVFEIRAMRDIERGEQLAPTKDIISV